MSIYHQYTQEFIADNLEWFENMMILTPGERSSALDFIARRVDRDNTESYETRFLGLERRVDTLWHREQERNLLYKKRPYSGF